MKPIAAEWVSKAEGDFAILERECRARKNPSYDGACFHAQQCAEKYLKARLCEAGISFSKIHDLVALLQQVLDLEPAWETFREDLAFLSDFAVMFRYPGESADRESTPGAAAACFAVPHAMRWGWKPEGDAACPGNGIGIMTSSRHSCPRRPKAVSRPSPNAAASARARGRAVGSRYLRAFTSARDWAGADPTLAVEAYFRSVSTRGA